MTLSLHKLLIYALKNLLKSVHPLQSELRSVFHPVRETRNAVTLTLIPPKLLGLELHSTPDASFQHPRNVEMIFLEELWNAWSLELQKFKVVLIRFYIILK